MLEETIHGISVVVNFEKIELISRKSDHRVAVKSKKHVVCVLAFNSSVNGVDRCVSESPDKRQLLHTFFYFC